MKLSTTNALKVLFTERQNPTGIPRSVRANCTWTFGMVYGIPTAPSTVSSSMPFLMTPGPNTRTMIEGAAKACVQATG